MNQEKSKDMIIFGIILIALLALAAFFAIRNKKPSQNEELAVSRESTPSSSNTPSNVNSNSRKQYSVPPENTLQEGKTYKAIIKTIKGNITVDLFAKQTPITVNNFVFLSREGFYNGTKFHRVIKNFMIQGGDPLGTGSGGPGYSFNDEAFDGAYERGTVAMANAGPNTNGSQFFIMHADMDLPKQYVIFGKVSDEKSLAVVDEIASTPVISNGSDPVPSKPKIDMFINSVEIVER